MTETPDQRKPLSTRERALAGICMVLSAALVVSVVLLLFVALQGVGPTCPGATYVPHVQLHTTETPEGFEVMVGGVSMVVPLQHYRVDVQKDGRSWTGFPATLIDTTENLTYDWGPSGEWLNFTDVDQNFGLSWGDTFTLGDLESGSEYQIVLRWWEDNRVVVSETVTAP